MKISTAGVMSINVPTSSRITLIIRIRTNGFCEIDTSPALIACGILAMVMIQLMAELTAIRNITTAVVTPVWRRISGRSRRRTSR